MSWFRSPIRDSPEDVRAAQRALVYAGYPRALAVTEVTRHLPRVRTIVAEPHHVLLAGLITGMTMAVGVVLILALSIGGLGLVMRTVGDSGAPYGIGPLGPTSTPSQIGSSSPLGILLAVAIGTPTLGLAGAGMAWVSRNRWRRAGALLTYADLKPDRRYVMEAAVVWLGVAGLIVLIVGSLAGPQLGSNVAQVLAFFAVPVSAAAFGSWFSGLYKHVLPHVSSVNAAAFARPFIERDAAREIRAERDFYGRSIYHRSAYDRSQWADQVLLAEPSGSCADAQSGVTTGRSGAVRMRKDSEPTTLGGWFRRYGLAAGGISVAGWLFIGRLIWIMTPGEANAWVHIVALTLGLTLGVGMTWAFARFIDDV